MDLQAASRIAGERWNLAKIVALICFLLAGGLLVMSLSGITRARADLGFIVPGQELAVRE